MSDKKTSVTFVTGHRRSGKTSVGEAIVRQFWWDNPQGSVLHLDETPTDLLHRGIFSAEKSADLLKDRKYDLIVISSGNCDDLDRVLSEVKHCEVRVVNLSVIPNYHEVKA